MKFDYVIGNPPYQERIADNFDKAVYNDFMDATYKVADRVILITPGRFLFNAGKTPEEWNKKMLADPHLKVLAYEPNGHKIFPSTEITSGIAITYRNSTANYGCIDQFFSFPELLSIYKKVVKDKHSFTTLDDYVYVQNKWNLSVLFEDHPKFKKIIKSKGKERRLRSKVFLEVPIFRDTGGEDYLEIAGLIGKVRVFRFIEKKYIDCKHPNLFRYKVLVPSSHGNGGAIGEEDEPTKLIGQPILGFPGLGYTQTYISIGAYDTREEAENTLKYIQSKFSRTLLGIVKVTQHNPKGTWKYVPLQDFTSNSDIDWSKSVKEIDCQLYKKYGLTKDEIEFIETKVKGME